MHLQPPRTSTSCWTVAPRVSPPQARRRPCLAPGIAGGVDAGAAAPPPPPPPLQLQASLIQSISAVSREQWDACHDGSNPFVSWDFLQALEESGSVAPEQGWLPQHVIITAGAAFSPGAAPPQEVLACVPLYLKSHSYGEYVFDNAWASAYDRSFAAAGAAGRYYPKLQSCVPFSPVPGPRLLVRPGAQAAQVRPALARALGSVAEELGVSSLHLTFHSEDEGAVLEKEGFLRRTGIQFHWENDRRCGLEGGGLAGLDPGGSIPAGRSGSNGSSNGAVEAAARYESFDDFLGALHQRRRKSIRQERKRVAAQGLRVRLLTGEEVRDASLWDAFYGWYGNTIDRKWGSQYLTRDFFAALSERMSDKVLLVVAEDAASGAPVAGALNLIGSDTLYGRNWGCAAGDSIKGLHFEVCYYAAIEHAIQAGLSRVEAGAQGEHKLQRGYLPSITHSSHYIVEPGFKRAVAAFLGREREEIGAYARALRQQASPYKGAAE